MLGAPVKTSKRDGFAEKAGLASIADGQAPFFESRFSDFSKGLPLARALLYSVAPCFEG